MWQQQVDFFKLLQFCQVEQKLYKIITVFCYIILLYYYTTYYTQCKRVISFLLFILNYVQCLRLEQRWCIYLKRRSNTLVSLYYIDNKTLYRGDY